MWLLSLEVRYERIRDKQESQAGGAVSSEFAQITTDAKKMRGT